jgi:hypothetical protein
LANNFLLGRSLVIVIVFLAYFAFLIGLSGVIFWALNSFRVAKYWIRVAFFLVLLVILPTMYYFAFQLENFFTAFSVPLLFVTLLLILRALPVVLDSSVVYGPTLIPSFRLNEDTGDGILFLSLFSCLSGKLEEVTSEVVGLMAGLFMLKIWGLSIFSLTGAKFYQIGLVCVICSFHVIHFQVYL